MLRWFFKLPLHLRIAIMVAPILFIGGWGLMDVWINPKQLQGDQVKIKMYELVVQGQCLLSQSSCTLSREGLTLNLAQAQSSEKDLLRINIQSSAFLRGLQLSIVQGEKEDRLIAQNSHETSNLWYVEFPQNILKKPSFNIRVAAAQTKKLSFATFPASL